VFYICVFDIELPEDDLKKVETCRSINEFFVQVYFYTCAFIGIQLLNLVECLTHVNVDVVWLLHVHQWTAA